MTPEEIEEKVWGSAAFQLGLYIGTLAAASLLRLKAETQHVDKAHLLLKLAQQIDDMALDGYDKAPK